MRRGRGGGRIVVERQHLVEQGLEGDEIGADEGVAGVVELVPVEWQARGERGVGVVAQAARIGDGDEEQIQRAQASTGQCWRRRSRTKRWSSLLNCWGVRRRRCGHSNHFSTIGASVTDVEGQLLELARGECDVYL